ncbi:MAG: N-acetylmuramoyl-L-alanine amidase [Nitrosomonadales bacterium]|nr:N-acetylmuramoyl-L-alanine amidase [Nitrosomonadales bacterium]
MKIKSVVIGLVLAALAVSAADAEARHTGGVRTQAIDMVVIHSTGGPTCDAKNGKPVWVKAGTLEENLRNIEAHPNLGIHYMIDRDGTLRASVPEDQMAHHVFHFSDRSIAIELINDGDGLDPFPEMQLASLVNLLRDIRQRRGIKRDGIRRHSDLDHARLPCDRTQRRKVDPGAAFPYEVILDRVFQQPVRTASSGAVTARLPVRRANPD